MKLIRGLIGLALVGGLVYAAVEIPLGDRTLVGHIRAISGTKEGQQLVEGVKQKAVEVKDRATGAVKGGDGGGAEAGGDDKLTDRERRLLRKLIREKLSGKGKQTGEDPGPGT